jgi:DNA-binding response OmpR family regulator
MHNNKTLLLVDDEMSILRSYARDLRAEHYTVTTASNGDEAIRALGEDYFNLVITDLIMPGPGGIEVLREAKKRNPASCVMVLTGYGDMSSAIEALRLGADDYLLKPLEIDELLPRLAAHLAKQQERQKIKLPRKILTLCAYCRDVQDDGGETERLNWLKWEDYLTRKTGITLSHGCCPACFERLKVDWEL